MTSKTRIKHARSLALLCIGGALLSSSVAAGPLERHAERPVAQASGTSYMQRSFTLPVAGLLDFRYFVDSELNGDFLRAYVDGLVVFEQSGADRVGRVRLPISAGAHVIRFAYEKNASGSAGRDTAQVDDIVVKSSKGQEVFRFNTPAQGQPEGWSSGGQAGGWVVGRPSPRGSLQRPASAAFSGYNPSGVVSSIQRSITWPTGSSKNFVKVGYQVDSEAEHDFFRVYVDGVQKLSVSGRDRSSIVTIDVGSSGAHVIRFAYEKDQSVDEGLDNARVFRVEAMADREAFQIMDLDGAAPGISPTGWSPSSPTQAPWTTASGVVAVAYVEPGNESPTIDGLREPAYSKGSRFRLGELAALEVPAGKLQALVSGTKVYLHGQIPAASANIGNESGDVTLYVDGQRNDTRRGIGCLNDLGAPGPDDRKIVVSYSMANGAQTANVTTAQFVGTCSSASPWAAAGAGQALVVVAALIEPEREGLLGFELSVDAGPSDAIGLALTATTTGGVTFEMPALDAQPVSGADTTTWATILRSAFVAKQAPAGAVIVGAPRAPDIVN